MPPPTKCRATSAKQRRAAAKLPTTFRAWLRRPKAPHTAPETHKKQRSNWSRLPTNCAVWWSNSRLTPKEMVAGATCQRPRSRAGQPMRAHNFHAQAFYAIGHEIDANCFWIQYGVPLAANMKRDRHDLLWLPFAF